MLRLRNTLLLLSLFTCLLSCQKEISTEQAAPAVGSLQSSSGDCLPKTVGGTYIVNKALIDSNFIEVSVNVTKVGAYTIATDTVNGYSFKSTGVFTSAGTKTVKLAGNGTPLVSGTDDFLVQFDSSVCYVSVQVQPAGTPSGPATFTLQGAPGACGSFVPSGNYVKDSTLNASNTVTVGVTVTAPGTYTITTNTVNGYSFSGTGTFTTTGAQTVVLRGTGKPVAVGTDNFTVTAGAATCSFSITCTGTAPPPVTNNDYFPLTLNSYWTYSETGTTDTFKITNVGTVTLSGVALNRFVYSDELGPYDTAYYRKDAATGFYYQSLDTAGSGANGVSFPTARVEIQFLRNSLTTNQTWNSDINATFQGAPVVFRYKYTCTDANATVTVNSKTYTGAYKITEEYQVGLGGTFSAPPGSPTYTYYYVKGVGLVQSGDGTDTIGLRFYRVF